jgi:hypothetical protein
MYAQLSRLSCQSGAEQGPASAKRIFSLLDGRALKSQLLGYVLAQWDVLINK